MLCCSEWESLIAILTIVYNSNHCPQLRLLTVIDNAVLLTTATVGHNLDRCPQVQMLPTIATVAHDYSHCLKLQPLQVRLLFTIIILINLLFIATAIIISFGRCPQLQFNDTYKQKYWLGKTHNISKKKTRLSPIRWYKVNIEVIVIWIDQLDEKKIAVNYKTWTIENDTNIAACILIKTRLERKDWVIRKKVVDKLRDIIKYYKNIRKTIDQTKYGIKEIYY